MSLKLGTTAPDFEAETTEGKIRFHDWAGDDWVIFFSHPADFTPVCTTELGLVARLKDKFDKRNAKALAISVDPLDSHLGWIKDIEATQNVKMNFPIVADPDKKVAKLYESHPSRSRSEAHRSIRLLHRPEQKDARDDHLPACHGSQLRGDPARARRPAAHRPVPGRDARQLEGR